MIHLLVAPGKEPSPVHPPRLYSGPPPRWPWPGRPWIGSWNFQRANSVFTSLTMPERHDLVRLLGFPTSVPFFGAVIPDFQIFQRHSRLHGMHDLLINLQDVALSGG